MNVTSPAQNVETISERPVIQSMMRGFRCKCPNCGQGKLFSSFSKSVDKCSVCNEDIHHHRADDFPAYLVIFVVGHIVVAGYLATELMFEWSTWQHMALWLPVTFIMSIVLLQPLKGAVIGLQWALRMHGFSGQEDSVSDL